jgi:putative endonuclease
VKKGAKYTKNRTPVSLVYYEVYETKQEAMKREYHIKRLSREDKLRLVESMDPSRLSLE